MPPFIQQQGKAGLIRDVEKRNNQALTRGESTLGPAKQVRSSKLLCDTSDLAMFNTGYEGDDDFGNAFEPLTSATDFDNADLAEMLVQNAENEDFVVQPDKDGRLCLVGEEIPSTTKL
ncbi:hypothetical protein CHU98_g3270 [Xylaria longipes]|nr:hypothetical protein CHU98_g3270 [Xylaria longipes]